MTAHVSHDTLANRSLDRLRVASLIAVSVGAVAAVGLLWRAGQRTPRLLLTAMAAWVMSPFIALYGPMSARSVGLR
jgi:hypothetical protein